LLYDGWREYPHQREQLISKLIIQVIHGQPAVISLKGCYVRHKPPFEIDANLRLRQDERYKVKMKQGMSSTTTVEEFHRDNRCTRSECF